jgi:hypothetical protein
MFLKPESKQKNADTFYDKVALTSKCTQLVLVHQPKRTVFISTLLGMSMRSSHNKRKHAYAHIGLRTHKFDIVHAMKAYGMEVTPHYFLIWETDGGER